ncbi:MAG: cadherin-like domain-containing protein, partial [Pirellulales bacterium]|nr:cadherin-like domain-containing protein [Pirellulales bacterium]
HGVAVANGNGTITYTPVKEFFGADSFRYTVRDDDGATSNQATVSVTVASVNDHPTVAITSPSDGQRINAGADIEIVVAAGDVDGQIARVEFFGDGSWLGTDNVADGFRLTWAAIPAGEHVLKVRAYDNGGAYADSASVQITVDPAESRGRKVGLYDSIRGKFYLQKPDAPKLESDTVFQYGPEAAGFIPLTGDWDGDGVDTVGLYDPRSSAFMLRNENSAGFANGHFLYGAAGAGWLPIVGDWNGDGIDTVGLYNPQASMFLLRNSNDTGVADKAFLYGAPGAGWLPVTGDWDGDGVDTVGLYNPHASAFLLRNANTVGFANRSFYYGMPGAGWKPVCSDWDGDGVDTAGLYDPQTSRFFLCNTHSSGVADRTVAFGIAAAGWQPVAGSWESPSTSLEAMLADKAPVGSAVSPAEADLDAIVAETVTRRSSAGVSADLLAVDSTIRDLFGS